MTFAQQAACPVSAELAAKIDAILDAHQHDYTHVVDILLEVQELNEKHYIPEPVCFYVAQKLPITIAHIYDVMTFYTALSLTPRAKYPIQICRSIVCKVNGSDELYERLKKLLGIDIGEVTYDGRFTLEASPCFGACDIAPAVRINGKVHGHLDSDEAIRAMLADYL